MEKLCKVSKNKTRSKLWLRGARYQIANICWIIEKTKEIQKNIYLCFID